MSNSNRVVSWHDQNVQHESEGLTMSEFDLLVQAYEDMGVPRSEAVRQAKFDMKSRLISMKYNNGLPLDEAAQ